MYSITNELDLISTTDLRSNLPKVTKRLKDKSVIVMSHNKPVGVFINYDKFRALQALEDKYKNQKLLELAQQRAKDPNAKYITLDELEKKLEI